MKCRILNEGESSLLREILEEKFIRTDSEVFQYRIKNKRSFSDGFHSSGYLWDCLKDYQKISERALYLKLEAIGTFYVTADDLSRDQVLNERLWPFKRESVAEFSYEEFYTVRDRLPEDLYFFTGEMDFMLALTHEEDDKRRICLYVGEGDKKL